MVDNSAVMSSQSSCTVTGHTCSTSLNTMPYRLMEQFVIKVQKDKEPAVWFYSVLFVDIYT